MTDHVTTVAVQNVPLLQALKDGGADSPGALAERASVLASNVHRKLDALEEDGLVVRQPGAPRHEAALTQKGEAALAILSIRMIPANQVVRWIDNPRSEQTLNDDELLGLARSIGDKGVLQPILVRPAGDDYQVIAGDRRRRAAQIAIARGWQSADFLIPAITRTLTDDEALEIAGVENVQRQNMHWMDEAKWFLRLSTRPSSPLSAAAIERLIGGERGKRSIQDYIKCARELGEEDVRRCYLPDGDTRQLTYVKARDLTGEKREKPALELSPKAACALVEMLDASEAQGWPLAAGARRVQLFTPPAGGPIGALADRKIVRFGFEGRTILANIPLTEELARYLQQIGFNADRTAALAKARDAAVGALQANALAPGEYVTPELNKPEAPPQEIGPTITPSQRRVLREIAARSLHRHRLLDGFVGAQAAALDDPDYQAIYDLELTTHRQTDGRGFEVALTLKGRDYLKSETIAPEDGKSANSCTTAWLRTDTPAEPVEDDELPLSGGDDTGPAPDVAPPAAPAPQADSFDLPAMLAIVAIELAHKVSNDGEERLPGTWAVEIRESYYKDVRGAQLVQKHRALAFMPQGRDKTLAALTKRCLDWLTETYDLVAVGDGRLIFDDELLADLQARMGFKPDKDGPYSTWWLNPVPQAAEAPASDLQPSPGEAAAEAHAKTVLPRADSFSDQLRAMGAEERVRLIERLCSALREARLAVSNATSRKLGAAEAEKVLAYIDAALEAASAPLEDA